MREAELRKEIRELTGRVAYLEGRVMEMSKHIQAISEKLPPPFSKGGAGGIIR